MRECMACLVLVASSLKPNGNALPCYWLIEYFDQKLSFRNQCQLLVPQLEEGPPPPTLASYNSPMRHLLVGVQHGGTENSYTHRLVSIPTITRAPISRQNSGTQKGPNDAERRRGFAMHDDLDFTYRISDRDAALPMLIDMGYHK